jgi:hypothetical protein
MKVKNYCYVALECVMLFLFSMCAPVNSHTKIKKTPDAYTRNYCCGEVSVPKSAETGGPWIVFSDRNQNPTYHNPGGKVKFKEVSFLTPLAVIGEKDDNVEVVKYDASLFAGRSVKDPAKVEYFGWMPKDNLILSSKAMTDVKTGYVMKMITMFRDTTPITRTDQYFTDGSVTLFSEPELLNPIGSVPFQKPVYLAKKSADKEQFFVIGKEDITPDNAESLVSGWVSSSMVLPMGEMLYADFSDMPVQNFTFQTSKGKQMSVPKFSMPRYLLPYELPDFVGFCPVYSIDETNDGFSKIKTTASVPVINSDNNMVYSLAGQPITKRSYDELLKSLKRVNIMIVFSGQKEVYSKFEQYVNYLQKIESMVKNCSKDFHFRLGYCVGFDAMNHKLAMSKPKDDISAVLSNLEKYSDIPSKKVKYSSDAWAALRSSMKLLSPYKDEQNIIILLGENGNQKEKIDDVLVNGLVEMNCRIIGCQLFSNTGNTFNNFVLQIEDMITRSTDKLSRNKKKMLVHSEQTTPTNDYKEYSDNVYGLDFPKNSMEQGWIIFPKKKENLSPDILLSVIDSTIQMIEYDTKDILSRISTSFKEMGMGRTSINPLWLNLCEAPSDYTISPLLFQPLSLMNPVTNYSASLRVEYRDLKKGKFALFVSEAELNRINNYLNDLLKVRVDVRAGGSSSKKQKSDVRSCPDMLTTLDKTTVDGKKVVYLNTSKVRKSMYKLLLRWAKDEKVYPKSNGELKNMSLAEIQKEVISYQSTDPLLVTTKLKAVKSKSKLIDSQLDKLQEYILSKLKLIDKAVNDKNRYEFNGQVYFKIDANNLP